MVTHPGRTPRSDKQAFEEWVRSESREPTAILEAGCGRMWELDLDDLDYKLVGVDLNAESLRLRQETIGDLDEAIVGDLRTVDLPSDHFDAAYCSFLLEHVEDADRVLDRMVTALKPGGLLLLRIPDRDSSYGWIVRHSPHRSHILYKRYIKGSKHAGKPGYGPFPVVYDPVVSLGGITQYCETHDLTILETIMSNGPIDVFPRRVRPAISAVLKGIAYASRGTLTASHANVSFVIQK